MNRRIFFKRASQALAGVAASLALGKFVEPKLLWEGDRNNAEYFSYSKDWRCGTIYPGGILCLNSDSEGAFQTVNQNQLKSLTMSLVARNYHPHMTIKFAYNVKTGELRLSRQA